MKGQCGDKQQKTLPNLKLLTKQIKVMDPKRIGEKHVVSFFNGNIIEKISHLESFLY